MSTSSSLETKNRYAICVGINRYQVRDQLIALRYAEQDAKDIYALLLAHEFSKEHSYLLLGEEATWEAIQQALTSLLLTRARKDDLVIFYFAGHGVPISINDEDKETEQEPPSDVFLCSSNFDVQQVVNERGAWLRYPLRMQKLRTDFFELAASRKVLFIFDSCHSGDFFGKYYRPRTSDNLAMRYIKQPFGENSTGRVVLSSCLPHQTSREDEQLGHGVFTYHLLEALSGRAQQAVRHDGWVTIGSLFDYIADTLPRNQRPVKSGAEHDSFKLVYYPNTFHGPHAPSSPPPETGEGQHHQKVQRLKALLHDHSSFMHNRLSSFVGREKELSEIRERIAEKQQTGGYVTITGQAGQGKSSIIAKLIEEHGPEKTAFHFIPFRPGPDHQVGLLRNLMARLILKYDLSDLYVASESRAALRDYFPKVLAELVVRNGQEVIFIDGLDQLEEELHGRDLSFLPDNPPQGVVFVLGTRPNDTLRPLELLKPRYEYKLPNLNRGDFDLILQHRGVHLSRELADRFYEVMQENALYLDLVAKELAETKLDDPVEVIERVADDPDNIFTLSIERLRHQERQWRNIVKPILGLLLAASEPLSTHAIRYILGADHDEVQNGLHRLGGLIAEDGQGRRYLYHLRFRDYLSQDRDKPHREYVFAIDEEERWHKKLVAWCEQDGIEQIWSDVKWNPGEQERREYARKHYVKHLYQAQVWHRLWQVLNQGEYGRSKVRYDPGNLRSYAQDLDLGRQAAAWEGGTLEQGIALLPNMWRYTLLHSSLTSRIDSYPEAAFELLVLLGREREALGMAELLTDPIHRAWALLGIARRMRSTGTELRQEGLQVLLRAVQLAYDEEDIPQKFMVLRALGLELVQVEQLEHAQEIGHLVGMRTKNYEVLRALGLELVRTEQFERAREVYVLIEDLAERFKVQCALYIAYIKGRHQGHALAIIQEIKSSSEWVERLRELSKALIRVGEWDQAERLARRITWKAERCETLRELGLALVNARKWDRARTLAISLEDWSERFRVLRELGVAYVKAREWKYARIMVLMIEDKQERDEVLHALGIALAQADEWQRTEEVLSLIERDWLKASVLCALGSALCRVHEWRRARTIWEECEATICRVREPDRQALALITLGKALAEAQHWWLEKQAQIVWKLAESTIRKIVKSDQRVEVWIELGRALAETQHREEAMEHWLRAETELALRILPYDPSREPLAFRLCQVFAHVGDWKRAIRHAATLEEKRHHALQQICELFAGLPEEVKPEVIVQIVSGVDMEEPRRSQILSGLCMALIPRHEWNFVKIALRAIDDVEERVKSLIALAEAGQQKLAGEFWSEVEAKIRRREEDRKGEDQTVQVLRRLAKTFLEMKEWDRMLEVILLNEQIGQRVEALQELADALIKEREWERVEAVIKIIEPSNPQTIALCNLSWALTQEQLWERAESIISIIERFDLRTQALRFLGNACFLARQGDRAKKAWEEAARVILSYEKGRERSEAMGRLAADLVESRQWELVEKIFNVTKKDEHQVAILQELVRALNQVRRSEVPETIWTMTQEAILALEDAQQRAEGLIALSATLIQAQQWTRADATIKEMQDYVEKANAFRSLYKALVEAQQLEMAKSVLIEAELAVRSINSTLQKVEALKDLGVVLVRVGQWEQAKGVWQEAEEATGKLDRRQMAKALIDIGVVLVQAKQVEWAKDVWQKAEKIVKPLESSLQKDEILQMRRKLLSDLVRALLEAQRWENAERVIKATEVSEQRDYLLGELAIALANTRQWKKVEVVIAMIEQRVQRIEALRNLIFLLLRMQLWERSNDALKMEVEEIKQLEGQVARSAALRNLGIALANAQQWEKAETIIRTIEKEDTRLEALQVLGDELTKARQWTRADMIWESAEALFWSLNGRTQADVLYDLVSALAKAQQWERAAILVKRMKLGGLYLLRDLGIKLTKAQQWERASEVLALMEPSEEKINLQRHLGIELIRAQEWEKADTLIKTILPADRRSGARVVQAIPILDDTYMMLSTQEIIYEASQLIKTQKDNRLLLLLELGKAFLDAQQWERARVMWEEVKEVIKETKQSDAKVQSLIIFAEALNQVKEHNYLLNLIRYEWLQANTRNYAVALLPLAYGLVPLSPEIGSAFCEAFDWVDTFLKNQ